MKFCISRMQSKVHMMKYKTPFNIMTVLLKYFVVQFVGSSICLCYKNHGSIFRCFVTPRKLETDETFWNYGSTNYMLNWKTFIPQNFHPLLHSMETPLSQFFILMCTRVD